MSVDTVPMRIQKDVIIARSGVYDYHKTELPAFQSLGEIPSQHKDKVRFSVYRPAAVLEMYKDKFTKLPIVYRHTDEVTPFNYRDISLGWTGDTARVVRSATKDEVVIESSANILDAEGMQKYYNGIREVSPWYEAKFHWQDGVSPNGKSYQIVMDEIISVNNLAITPNGKGGSEVAIKDEAGRKSFKSGLMYFLKRTFGVKDDDMGAFRTIVEALAVGYKSLKPEEQTESIEKAKSFLADMPESEEREKLSRYLEDLPTILEGSNEEQSKKASEMIIDLFEKLDTDTMNDGKGAKDMVIKDSGPELEKGAAGVPKSEETSTVSGEIPEAKPEEKGNVEAEPEVVDSLDKVPDGAESWGANHANYVMDELHDMLKHIAGGKSVTDWKPRSMRDEVEPEAEKKEEAAVEPPAKKEPKEEPKEEIAPKSKVTDSVIISSPTKKAAENAEEYFSSLNFGSKEYKF